eukprot:81652-Chlamydomonas_euryale.AAC.1
MHADNKDVLKDTCMQATSNGRICMHADNRRRKGCAKGRTHADNKERERCAQGHMHADRKTGQVCS